ncbi:MAG: hypothetical protein HYZ33_03890 [Ignavibacteriales bacterium]|nr:hypothetical protein [Ignavibacteriales bacterium]
MTEMTRESLREEIERVYQTSLMRMYWRAIGRGLARLIGRKNEAPAWVSFTVAFMMVQLVTTVARIALKEQQSTAPMLSVQFSYPMLAYCWLGLMIFQMQIERFINYFKTDIVNSLDLPDSQPAIESWLRSAGARSLQAPIMLVFVAWMALLTVLVVFGQSAQSAGVSVYIFTVLVFIQIIPHLYWVMVIAVTFAFSVRQWKFKLFPDDPSKTPVIQTFHRLSSNFLLAIALLLALNQLIAFPLDLYSKFYISAMVAALWTPTLLFFIFRESAFAHLLVNARLQRLAIIQQQIMEIESNQDMSQKEPAEAVKRLLDLHDRVKSVPVSMINLSSIANLLGSLALPVLAALLNIFDIWHKIFGTP